MHQLFPSTVVQQVCSRCGIANVILAPGKSIHIIYRLCKKPDRTCPALREFATSRGLYISTNTILLVFSYALFRPENMTCEKS